MRRSGLARRIFDHTDVRSALRRKNAMSATVSPMTMAVRRWLRIGILPARDRPGHVRDLPTSDGGTCESAVPSARPYPLARHGIAPFEDKTEQAPGLYYTAPVRIAVP